MSNNKFKILVVEDEANIRDVMETILGMHGYQVLSAKNGEQGNMMFQSYYPDLILLDLGLPDFDGTKLIQEVRKTSAIPIIVLSARTQESDKVEALDLGANDYVTKPFGTAELLARVRAVLRSCRYGRDDGVSSDEKFQVGDLKIDYNSRNVKIGKKDIKLTQTEYNIVAFLSKHAGKVMTYSTIIQEIWGTVDEGSVKKLQVNMANIRKKFGTKPGSNQYIANELGVGYRMYHS